MWLLDRDIKMANRTSHRYNRLPLLPSDPGGVQQELVVPICRRKDTIDRAEKVIRLKIPDKILH
jgi:hypothetical protein